MRIKATFLALPLLAVACGGKSDSKDGPGLKDPDTGYRALVFSTIAVDYGSGKVLVNDLETGTLTEALAAESGDALVAPGDGGAWVFNRKADKLNFKWLDLSGEAPAAGTELAPGGVEATDPVAVLELAPGRLLLANANNKSLVVIDPATGALLQTVTADWDIGEGTAFRPTLLWKREQPTGNEILVFTTGRGADAYQTYEGSQRVFWLVDKGPEGLEVIDLDPETAKVQGLPLRANPAALFPATDGEAVMSVGLCGMWDPETCAGSGVDRIDLAARTVTTALDLMPHGYKFSGQTVGGRDGLAFVTAQKAGGDGASSHVIRIDVAAGTVTEQHAYPAGNAAYGALIYDDSAKRLWVGDREANQANGFFTVIPLTGDEEPARLDLPGLPYTGGFVRK